MSDENECCICFAEIENGTTLYPCGHDAFCVNCADDIKTNSKPCPICRDLTCNLQTFIMLGGGKYKLQIDTNTSCILMKKLLEPLVGVTKEEFQLVHCGRVVADKKIIQPNKSPIHIVLNLRGD